MVITTHQSIVIIPTIGSMELHADTHPAIVIVFPVNYNNRII